MIYLLCAIASSAMVSIFMRLSTGRIKGNISMLTMNYVMCLAISVGYTGVGELIPLRSSLFQTLGMGLIHGILYLLSFVLLQVNVKRNGVVLSATFMKLGLLVPMVVSLVLFGEQPGLLQILGFIVALGAIVLINFERGESVMQFRIGLILLLLGGGCGDAMSKIFDELGDPRMSDQFLFYTFVTALALCTALMIYKGQRIGISEVFFGLLIGVPNFYSARFLLWALEELPGFVVYPSYSVGTILVVTLAGVVLFRERLGKRQRTALGTILVALALLNL